MISTSYIELLIMDAKSNFGTLRYSLVMYTILFMLHIN